MLARLQVLAPRERRAVERVLGDWCLGEGLPRPAPHGM